MEGFTYFKPILDKLAVENGFKNYKMSIEMGSDLGFNGEIKRCRIIENERELSLMCKLLPKNQENAKLFPLFEREVKVYKELFPVLESFQIENGLKVNDAEGFWNYPKCYYCNFNEDKPEESIIIMEDLTKDNFEVKNKFVCSDFQHTSKLFETLAKFHGISLALNLKKPEIFEKFNNMKSTMCTFMKTDFMNSIVIKSTNILCSIYRKEADKEIYEKIQRYKDNIWDKFLQVYDDNFKLNEPFSVICHGDAWINNVLYNYTDNKKCTIKDIRIVDWQTTFCGSLGSDLMYYLYCCVDKTTRDQHQDELLHIYYESMENILKRFRLDIVVVLPYNEFENQLRINGLYAFGMATFGIPLLCKYPEKLLEDENAILTEEEQDCVKHYNQRMKDIIMDMIDMKIL